MVTNMDLQKTLAEALPEMQNGDLLLVRQQGLIARAGRGKYSHAAMFAWWNDEPFCLEVLQGKGGRAVHLAQMVNQYPGQYEVFQANADARWGDFQRDATVRFMCQLTGCKYGYHSVMMTALLHLPLVRFFTQADTDDASGNSDPQSLDEILCRPFCSQAVSMAYRIGGGVNPVPQLADRYTEPNDLARSPFFRRFAALVPDTPPKSQTEMILYEAAKEKF